LGAIERGKPGKAVLKIDGFAKSLSYRHPGERRGPEHPEKTGFLPDSIRDPPE
jgi:hypothetical protein